MISALPFLRIQEPIYCLSLGVAIFGVGTGFIGLSVARKAGKRMKAVDGKIEDLKKELNTKIQMLIDKGQGKKS